MNANSALAAPVESADLLGELEGSLGFLLRVAQIRAFERFYAVFADQDLRPGEFTSMWVIGRNPGIRQGILARELWIKPAHMTKMIRRLENLGRIKRLVPDDDRRSVRLFLTKRGEEVVSRNRESFLGQNDYHNHGLSKAETRELAYLLRRYAGIEPTGR